jgi:hypothetical protein
VGFRRSAILSFLLLTTGLCRGTWYDSKVRVCWEIVKGKGNLANKKTNVGDTACRCLCLGWSRVSVVTTASVVVNKPICVGKDIFLGRRYLYKSEPERRVGFGCNKRCAARNMLSLHWTVE